MKSLTQNSTMFEPCKATPGHRRYFLSFQSPNVLSKNEWHVKLPRFREFCKQHLCVSSFFFFSEKSQFFMEIFPEIEGPSHQPKKYISFHVFFFRCASGVPRGRNAWQRKSSKSEQRIERIERLGDGEGYQLKGHQ